MHPILLTAYSEWLHPKLHFNVLQVFEDYSTGKIQDPRRRRAKGTKTRAKGVQTHMEFRQACEDRKASWIPANGTLHHGLWGKSASEKATADRIKQPFRDNISVDEHVLLSAAEALARLDMRSREAVGQGEVNESCRRAAYLANLVKEKDEAGFIRFFDEEDDD
jgi:hypothetical protein